MRAAKPLIRQVKERKEPGHRVETHPARLLSWRLSGLAALGLLAVPACRTSGSRAHATGATLESEDKTPAARSTWDWNGVIGTGQSLSVGVGATDVTLPSQPFGNLKLALGDARLAAPPYDPTSPSLSLVPLVEPIRPESPYAVAYPANIHGETPSTAMGDQISTLFGQRPGGEHVTVLTVVGESGRGIDVIDKTAVPSAAEGHAYAATLFEVAAIERLASAAGKTYGVAAITLTHGETDAKNTGYEAAVYQLLQDYNRDIAAITGQARAIPLFLTQQQTEPPDNSSSASLIAEWQIGRDHPGEVVCVGPKYQYPYATDHLHLVAEGYDRLGEKYAEVYYERVILGHDWQPLQPLSASRNGKVIMLTMHVPSPPLAWDGAMPAPHQSSNVAWSNGRGFEVANRNRALDIASVAIQGDAVVIALASDPDPSGLVVRYAVTQDEPGVHGGLSTGRIGQLRDSDPLIGYSTKAPQYNYAVSFAWPVE
jgi:hypothetical protein